jgi:outer membrane receptor protein involved in Fe transport
MEVRKTTLKLALGAGCALAVLAAASATQAEERTFNVASARATDTIPEFARQAGIQIVAPADKLRGVNTPAIEGRYDTREALAMLVEGTGLRVVSDDGRTVMLAADPQGGSASDGAEGTVEALIVTAQKREEDIQDVPIAISAFTQEQLERSQVAGGPDLITQVPNMTFTKTNFSSYSIQIRGIGTQAISATTDAAVAVAFNNTPFIRNRFFEQEFYDLQRVEVLRGPQGTLYGRNATAGVVNLISQKPKFAYEAKLSADVSNYNSSRLEGMLNIPLVEDKVALRLAGAWTKREGYVTNEITGNPIDGRDLWSTRLSLRFAPTDAIDVNLIWEHFEEDDDRLRSGKQLCDKHVVTDITAFMPERSGFLLYNGQTVTFPTSMTTPIMTGTVSQTWQGVQGTFSQGCKPSSLYAEESFQTPNGLSLPFVHPLKSIGVPINTGATGNNPYFDPYASTTQSRDLRVIESTVDPQYRAETDVVELQFSIDLTDALTLTSETGYGSDTIFSTQDYNRFNTAPGVFELTGSGNIPGGAFHRVNWINDGPNGDIFCDPQIGCADRLVAVDLSTAVSSQFSQEFRISSDYDGPFNFSLGANFLRYDTEDKYYVFINTLSAFAALSPFAATRAPNTQLSPYEPGVTDNVECLRFGMVEPDPTQLQTLNGCVYMDPNPIDSLNDLGHNYFLSRNPYKLISYAVFGEGYYNITDNLKVTAGLRWTVDKKEAPRIPSWILAADTVGYPVAEVVEQEWREPTGRLTIDWKPDLAFTDETLLYGSYAHGYKAGGMNPPASGIVCFFCTGFSTDPTFAENLLAATHPKTFAPEFVDAFEIGAKNTLLDGKLTLNTAAFYYDYEGYQISQIVNRAAVNYNFDAEVWGLEIEADWRPLENLRLGFKGGYENTRVADGMMAVDVMDRTAGDPNWVLVRPFPTFPSNCIVPAWLFVGDVPFVAGTQNLLDVGNRGTGGSGPCEIAYVMGLDPITGREYVANPTLAGGFGTYGDSLNWRPGYPGWDPSTAPNHGAGISKDLSGNELPNAPHYTATITADYTVPLPNDWLATLHTDLYYQSESWARIFNTEGYDKLKAFTNVNLAAIFTNEEAGWKVMAYVKNVFDRANITGSFLNSDDSGLTTNVFLTEPRLYGLRVTKEFTGGPWWTGANPDHTGPYPLTVELAGMVQRQDAPHEAFPLTSTEILAPQVALDDIQNRDLDWGDGRSVKLSWRPDGSPWNVSAGVRYGRTNSDRSHETRQYESPERICKFFDDGSPYGYIGGILKSLQCDPASPKYNPGQVASPTDWTAGGARNREEHTIVDFAVGRDFGLGSLSQSTVVAGIRYGEFESLSSVALDAAGDWDVPEGWGKYNALGDPDFMATVHTLDVNLDAVREFSGSGPTLTWDAAATLLGGDAASRVNLDWELTAGVLFGKQETSFSGGETDTFRGGYYPWWPFAQIGDPVVTPAPADRSRSVTVPVIDLSLGLSYEVGRINVGAGYRWERYFDVLDVGYDEANDGDRTIDGPYFKIAVGFGG